MFAEVFCEDFVVIWRGLGGKTGIRKCCNLLCGGNNGIGSKNGIWRGLGGINKITVISYVVICSIGLFGHKS